MKFTKETFVAGLALFSMFFGAGNLILPPYLGFNAGSSWVWVTLGFIITAIVIPILAIIGHAKLQGTMRDFGNKVSPYFSLVYCFIMYIIAVTLPAPRTASVTHEMAIYPFFPELSSWVTSTIYFALAFVFAINRTRILNLIGKFLTPLIVIILLAVIVLTILSPHEAMIISNFETPLVSGLLEGYQTFDAIGGVVVGAVVIISLNLQGTKNYAEKKQLIINSGIIAGLGLLLMYAGLIVSGALFSNEFMPDITRTKLLSNLSFATLGVLGNTLLSILIALACFTTAVGIITGTADFIKGLTNNSKSAYTITAIISCVLGVVIGQFDVHYIIDIALPALMFIYPITIMLILLNVLPEKYASKTVFRAVIIVTFLFSIPDFLGFLLPAESLASIKNLIPLSQHNLGWVLPGVVVFCLVNIYKLILIQYKNK
jgi:LIVCS family branched-chain amino acid:cation transporter